MSDTGRGGLWLAVLVVLAVLGTVGYFALSGAGPHAGTPEPAEAIAKPEPEPAEAPVFRATETPEPVPVPVELEPKDGAPRPPAVTETPKPKEQVALEGAVVARGRVLWAGGRLPAESDVLLYDFEGSDLDVTTTGPDGEFELRYDQLLAPGWSFGTDEINVVRNGEPFTLVPVLASGLPAHAPGDPPVERDLVVGFAPTLVGAVTDKQSHQPIAGAEVYAASTLPPWTYEQLDATTGPDGRFELSLEGLPLEGLIVWATAEDYQTTLAGPLDFSPVKVPAEPVTQDFALPPAMIVKGRVIEQATGEPFDGATITVGSRYAAFTDFSDWEATDENGMFELDTSAIAPTGGWLAFSGGGCAALALPLESATSFVEVSLGPPVTVAGSVVDEKGAPVASASVRIAFDGDTQGVDQGMFDEAYTDATGHFELTLELVPVDHALVRIESLAYEPYEVRLADIAQIAADGHREVAIKLRGN